LACRAEEFRSRAVMRGTQDKHQLGRIMCHQLRVGVCICCRAPPWIDVRGDEPLKQSAGLARQRSPGSLRRIEEGTQLRTQRRRLVAVAKPGQRGWPFAKREERRSLVPLPLAERRGVQKEGTIERCYQPGQLLER